MDPDDPPIPLSALQHYEFCPRQCVLIHGEGEWSENRLTAEGRVLHERVHDGEDESRSDVRIARGLWLCSERYGLVGVADVVEFHRVGDGEAGGVALPGASGHWRPYPVEYKRGKPKRIDSDRRQLAAQALCLAEMLGVPVPAGALYYGEPRRREEVVFSDAFLEETVAMIATVRKALQSGAIPPPKRGAWCESCSLGETCLPAVHGRSALRYLARMIGDGTA